MDSIRVKLNKVQYLRMNYSSVEGKNDDTTHQDHDHVLRNHMLIKLMTKIQQHASLGVAEKISHNHVHDLSISNEVIGHDTIINYQQRPTILIGQSI